LTADLTPLQAQSVVQRLGALAPHFDVRVVQETASTNADLMDARWSDGARSIVLAAEHQTAGRGRRGRSWQAWPGHSLTFSLLWRFTAPAPKPGGLSLAVGVAVAATLEQLGVEGVQLKWPNDVLIFGRKLAGILVELQHGTGGMACVCGIGVNVSLPEDAAQQLPPMASLASALGNPPDRNDLLASLLCRLHDVLERFAQDGFPALEEAWSRRNAHAGLPVRLSAEDGEVDGIMQGVDSDGALLLATAQGVRRILNGEVTLRPRV
jgi:BirA family biotin operon repressor/biotin-[acetyl-CoA-carboxylase] ligase